MAYKNLEFKVGLFVVIGAVILAGSLYWLQGFRLQRDTQTVQVLFDDVGMLKVGNIVTVASVLYTDSRDTTPYAPAGFTSLPSGRGFSFSALGWAPR